jgi:hypothetical protein
MKWNFWKSLGLLQLFTNCVGINFPDNYFFRSHTCIRSSYILDSRAVENGKMGWLKPKRDCLDPEDGGIMTLRNFGNYFQPTRHTFDIIITSVKTERLPPFCLLCCSLCFPPFPSHSFVCFSFYLLLQLCLFVAENLGCSLWSFLKPY